MNIPTKFTQYCADALGEQHQVVMDALRTESPTSIRYNPRKIHSSIKDQVLWCPYGEYLSERPSFTFDPMFHGGGYYVQEASSMFLWHVLEHICESKKDLKVLDLCAAPGGKSTLIASFLDGEGLLHSNEIIRSRANILLENMTKWGYSNIVVTNNDPVAFARSKVQYDIIVVDAPCSGEGLWRKDHNAINEWSKKNVLMCAHRQRNIIDAVYDSLAPEGYLIYSTCTFNNLENINNCDAFIEHHALEKVDINPPQEWNIITQRGKKSVGYQFVPTIQRGEGFFCSVFQKVEGKTNAIKKPKKPLLSAYKSDMSQWIALDQSYTLLQNKYDDIYLQPKAYTTELEEILSNLSVLTAGTFCGKSSKKGLIPEHYLAVSHALSSAVPSVTVDETTALNFLRKEPVQLVSDTKGWHIVRYDDVQLGLIKHLGNRVNNYYPTNWRIRKNNIR